MQENSPILLWLRRDLRLSDHEALNSALSSGRAVIAVYIYDAALERLGAAARWRMGAALEQFSAQIEALGGRLILRRGPAGQVLDDLIAETGAGAVYWSRLYDPFARERDARIKADLRARGIEARSFSGHLLFEPWAVETGQGGPYRVYSPYWRAVCGREIAPPLPAVQGPWPAPARWPASETLADWALGAQMRRGAEVLGRYAGVGEACAQDRLATFLKTYAATYKTARDFPALGASSGLSENLTYGEISPRQIWTATRALMAQMQDPAPENASNIASTEHFLKELVWREFAWHLYYHYPTMSETNWRAGWEAFPWRGESADLTAWQRARTGEPFVDAALREMYVTGRMHNRARMIVASYLTKHLLTDWRHGLAWFAECLTDWDEAANAMGWQWVAGCGPDAAPYFRVFNPAGQAEKFEAKPYIDRYIAEGRRTPAPEALDYFAAVPRAWSLDPQSPYPRPIIDLAEGRARALSALASLKDAAPQIPNSDQ